jgi:hypothetical protein
MVVEMRRAGKLFVSALSGHEKKLPKIGPRVAYGWLLTDATVG